MRRCRVRAAVFAGTEKVEPSGESSSPLASNRQDTYDSSGTGSDRRKIGTAQEKTALRIYPLTPSSFAE